MLGKTITQNLNEGPWADLVNTVMPAWISGGFGFDFIRYKGKIMVMESVTHRYFFDTTHCDFDNPNSMFFQKPSRIYLDSLPDERQAEVRYKGKRYGMIYIPELSAFKSRKTFDVLIECLRVIGAIPESHRMICDTNPAEEGEESWIWQLWYWFRTLDLSKLNEEEESKLGMSQLNETERASMIESLRGLQSQLALHEFIIDDNPWLTASEKSRLKAQYVHDKNLYERYFLGKWTQATGDGLFSRVWRPNIHVIGGQSGIFSRDVETLVPEKDCIELGVGWDTGSANMAATFVEKVAIESETESGPQIKTAFKVFDEVVYIGKQIVLEDVVYEILDKMHFWEKFIGRKVVWRHWSDSSSLLSRELKTSRTEAQEIMIISDGEIQLMAKPKLKGSVEMRFDLLARLLHEGRIFFSSTKCPMLIQSITSLQKTQRGTIDRASRWKHAVDALTYYLSAECWSEIAERMMKAKARSRGNWFNIIVTPI